MLWVYVLLMILSSVFDIWRKLNFQLISVDLISVFMIVFINIHTFTTLSNTLD